MSCISKYVNPYKSMVERSDDAKLLLDLERSSLPTGSRDAWYVHSMPSHRLWLRLVKQEVHHRGLG